MEPHRKRSTVELGSSPASVSISNIVKVMMTMDCSGLSWWVLSSTYFYLQPPCAPHHPPTLSPTNTMIIAANWAQSTADANMVLLSDCHTTTGDYRH
jgi:hypothetical protein